MPYYENGKEYARVTEVISRDDCEAVAYADKNLKHHPRSSHAVALAGTMVHARIEQYEAEKMGTKPPGMYLEETDAKLLGRMRKESRKAYDDLIEKSKNCFANFLAFDADFPHEPLFLERRLMSEKLKFGGTTDMIARMKIRGLSHKRKLHKSMPVKEYVIPCPHNTYDCGCSDHEVAVLCDWKSSTRSQKGHRVQLSAYFYLWEDSGIFDELRKGGLSIYFATLSVLLGPHNLKKTKTPYQAHWYSPEPSDFLVACQPGRSEAEHVTRGKDGRTGLKGRCMFCSVIASCPDRILWNTGGDVVFPVALSNRELFTLKLALGMAKTTLGEREKTFGIKDLIKKIELIREDSKKQEKDMTDQIPEIYEDARRLLGILPGTTT